MSDFTTTLSAHTTTFTHAKRREIVVKHEFAHRGLKHGVDDLLIIGCSQSHSRENLSFSTGEERTSMSARQKSRFNRNGSDCFSIATVDSDFLCQNHFTHQIVLKKAKSSFDVVFHFLCC